LGALKSKVIEALGKASEPALSNCEFHFGIDDNRNGINKNSLMDPT
jgi:hypothetical protein